MSSTRYKQDDIKRSRTKKNKQNPWNKIIVYIAVTALWGGLVFGGFYYAKQYLDQTIRDVQETNAMNIRKLETRLDNLSAEMTEVKKALKETDQTLSSSDTTQRELNEKINKLNSQLQDLEKSLKILKEAP